MKREYMRRIEELEACSSRKADSETSAWSLHEGFCQLGISVPEPVGRASYWDYMKRLPTKALEYFLNEAERMGLYAR